VTGGAELARALEWIDAASLHRHAGGAWHPDRHHAGRYGGYQVVPGFKLPPMIFSDRKRWRWRWD
jgi:hypothetical protein